MTHQPAAVEPHWYSIGEVARTLGVSPAVVRLWEQEDLVRPRRTDGGHRLYSADDLERLRRVSFLRRVERLNAAAIRRELGPVTPGEPPPGDQDPALGRRLRALRRERGLSLAEIAAHTGLSISFLSAVERGQSGISLGNLFKLADALGTTVPGLQTRYRPAGAPRLRPAERPRYVGNHGLVLIEDLIVTPGALEAQRIEILPGGESEEAYAHPGEELVYVVSGQLTVWIEEDEEYRLDAGDSLSFRSTRLHRWRNEGSEPAVVLWVNAPVVGPEAESARRPVHPRPAPPGARLEHGEGANGNVRAVRPPRAERGHDRPSDHRR